MKGHICHARSVKYAFLTVARMEWKAEKRAQGIIREWHLPIDLVDYNKEANLHICLYHMYQKHHRYGARNNPATDTILAMMPKTMSNRMWIYFFYKTVGEKSKLFCKISGITKRSRFARWSL
jgi:hypothetical protein